MSSTAGWRDVLRLILRALVEELRYKAASVRQLDAERRTLVLTDSVGLSETYLRKGTVELDKSPMDREVLSGKITEIENVHNDHRLQYPEASFEEGIGSVIAVPMALRDRVIGVLRVYSSHARKAELMEKKFLQVVARLTARALITSYRAEILHNLSRQINSSLDPQVVLAEMLRRTVQELNYKGGIIRLLDLNGERLEIVAATGLTQEYLNKGGVAVGRSAIDQSVLQGKSVTIYDVEAEPGYQYPEAALKEGIRSVQAVPLMTSDRTTGQERVIGVLRVYSAQPQRFGEDEISFLQSIANLGAIALENARLYHEMQSRYEALRSDEEGWYRLEES